MDGWVDIWMDGWIDGRMDGYGGGWMDRWMNRQMAFGIQTVRSPDDLSGREKSSHFMKFRVNSSSLLLSSNTDF